MTASSSTRLLGFNPSSGDFDYLTTNSSGYLNVSIPSGSFTVDTSLLSLESTQSNVLSNIVASNDKLQTIADALTGNLAVVVQGDASALIKGNYSGTPTAIECSSTGKLQVVANAYDTVSLINREIECDTTGAISVQVKNALPVAVSSTTTSPVYTRGLATSTIQVATTSNIVGPQQVGTIAVDCEGYLWLGAYISCPMGVTVGGNIYFQYSPDNASWGQSWDSVYIGTSVSPTVGLIRLSTPVPFRYVRLWADTGFTADGVTASICMK